MQLTSWKNTQLVLRHQSLQPTPPFLPCSLATTPSQVISFDINDLTMVHTGGPNALTVHCALLAPFPLTPTVTAVYPLRAEALESGNKGGGLSPDQVAQ